MANLDYLGSAMAIKMDAIPQPTAAVINSAKDWLPLIGFLVLHLILGSFVDQWKDAKPIIQELLAR